MAGRKREPVRLLQSVDRLLPHDVEQSQLRRFGFAIDEVHDPALMLADNSGMRLGCEVPNCCGMPVIAASQAAPLIHALLDDSPFAFDSENEGVEIDLESVRNRIVVDSRREAAGTNQRFTVEPALIGDRTKLSGGVPGMPATAATNVDAKFVGTIVESAFQSAHDGRG